MKPSRNPYPTDVSDEERAFVVPYLILLPEDTGQRSYSRCELFNGLRWIARAGAPWRLMPNDLPPWWVVYQQTQRWLAAGCFDALVDDLRLLLRSYAILKAMYELRYELNNRPKWAAIPLRGLLQLAGKKTAATTLVTA